MSGFGIIYIIHSWQRRRKIVSWWSMIFCDFKSKLRLIIKDNELSLQCTRWNKMNSSSKF
jgi:hypothetical protein